jgi:kynurenine formamidase
MKLYLNLNSYIDTSKGHDISIPLSNNDHNPLAWYLTHPIFEIVRSEGYVGAVAEGGSVNFRTITFNPHGHGTHTECLGHITNEVFSINQHLKESFFMAELISVQPSIKENKAFGGYDHVITKEQLQNALSGKEVKAVVLRTTPNSASKKQLNYTNTNPPYLDVDCIKVLDDLGVEHFLIDLPSVDREIDGGKLAFHHSFWGVPNDLKFHKTITEFIYVPDHVKDGIYLLNLQTAPFENDATPSRPVLFSILSE